MPHASARLAAILALAALSAGCMLPFCGPTTYYLSGVTMHAALSGTWDAAAMAEAMEREGLTVAPGSTDTALQASGGGRTLYANARPQGAELALAYPAQAEGSSREVDRAADAVIDARHEDANALVARLAESTGLTLAGEPTWDKGTLHGDC